MKTRHTEAQQRAITTEAAKVIVVAGPGSGKTETIAARVRELVTRYQSPQAICAVTYTNAAARNLEARVGNCPDCDGKGWVAHYHLNGDPPDQEACRCEGRQYRLGFCGTLHGLGLRMLRQYGHAHGWGERTAVLGDEGAAELLASKATSMGCKTTIKKLLEMKTAGRPPLSRRLSVEELTLAAYFNDLRDSGLVDFDLILSEFAGLLGDPSFRSSVAAEFTDLLVDEVQDCAAPDWAIFRTFPAARLFLVGDPRQAIFGFRGGRVELMTRFAAEEETTTLCLADNFRCASSICQVANDLLQRAPEEFRAMGPTVSATGETGDADGAGPFETEGEEIAYVVRSVRVNLEDGDWEPEGVAVLARTNDIARSFREALKVAGIPVVEPPFEKVPKDWALAQSLVELAAQPKNDTLAYFFILEQMKTLYGETDGEARKRAHAKRLEAQHARRSLASTVFGGSGRLTLADLPTYLEDTGFKRDTRALVAQLIRELPPGSDLSDLALAMARGEPDPKGEGAGVTCTTFHSAKGREWGVVYLVGLEDESMPGKDPDELEEARRLLFVGITRARSRVVLTSSRTRRATWGPCALQNRTPSRFLEEAIQ